MHIGVDDNEDEERRKEHCCALCNTGCAPQRLYEVLRALIVVLLEGAPGARVELVEVGCCECVIAGTIAELDGGEMKSGTVRRGIIAVRSREWPFYFMKLAMTGINQQNAAPYIDRRAEGVQGNMKQQGCREIT